MLCNTLSYSLILGTKTQVYDEGVKEFIKTELEM
jgi:hypothetical protein